MSNKKVIEVDSIYSGNSAKRSRILDDISCSSNIRSGHWTSVLSCCWRRSTATGNREKNQTVKEYNTNDWDYIVEKLVVKRVPISLYATEEDFQESIEDSRNEKNSSYNPIAKDMRDRQVFSAMPEIGSNLYFLKTKGRGDLSNKPSSKNLRFNRDEDLLDEDAQQAGPSNYNKDISNSRIKEFDAMNEYLNQFSALHPDLKSNERVPKDPHPLNPPRNKRSLAENISEIASTTHKNSSAKTKKGKIGNKRESNVYITVSDTSREISNVLGEEEIPRRDKDLAKNNSLTFKKNGAASFLQYPKKPSGIQGITESIESKQIHREKDSSCNYHCKFSQSRNAKPLNKESKLKLQQLVSSKKHSINKLAKSDSCESDGGFRGKNHLELSKSVKKESVSEATSYASDDYKNSNSTGTTLRWKIIIKHHEPTASHTDSESVADFSETSTIANTLNDGLDRSKQILMNTATASFDKMVSNKNE